MLRSGLAISWAALSRLVVCMPVVFGAAVSRAVACVVAGLQTAVLSAVIFGMPSLGLPWFMAVACRVVVVVYVRA